MVPKGHHIMDGTGRQIDHGPQLHGVLIKQKVNMTEVVFLFRIINDVKKSGKFIWGKTIFPQYSR